MNNLAQVLTGADPQEVEEALYAQGITVAVDWRKEDDALVPCFSDKVEDRLTCT